MESDSQQILKEIQKYPKMADLPVSKYAEEDGLADNFILAMKQSKKELKATQLRKFFHQIKHLQHEVKRSNTFDRLQVASMMPILAYAVGRDLIPKDFYELMKLCFGQQRCQTKEDFLSSANFLEAVMAYHKYRS
ncbi:MAG: type III-A CRISPR-associated protein Csm2 [Anaerolineaceae bacterium]|nr:type III-A CRISPR-associated protein Csm2 [Anaerolineaceae bacterium]